MLKLDFKNIHIIPPAGLIRQHLFKRVLKSVFIQHAVKLYRLCNTSHGLPWLMLPGQRRAGALFIRGSQHGQIGFRTAADEQGHIQKQEWLLWPQSIGTRNNVILGTCMMCSPGHAGLQKRPKSTSPYESGSCNCWWSDAQLVTGFLCDLRKVLNAPWAVMCFQRGCGCTACLGDVRNLCSPKLHIPYEGMRKKPNRA